MATEQQLAQALSPYDPYYLQNLALGQGTPSLLGNTSAIVPVKQLGNYELATDPLDRDNAYVDPNPAWTDLTPTQRAEYFQDPKNALMAGATQLGQKVFSFSKLGKIQDLFAPTIQPAEAQIAQGITPQQTFRASEMAQQDAVNNAFAAAQAAQTQSISDQSNAGADPSSNSPAGGFGEGQYAHGGRVNKNHLTGPDPKGPDDGYGALQGGEFVVKKAAVKKYGEGMLGKINAGKYAPRG